MSTRTFIQQKGIGLLFTKTTEYVPVARAMAPLFYYMRLQASEADPIYRIRVDPSEISQSKLFPPEAVPITGADAVYGAVGGPWDVATLSFEDHYLYQSIRDHLDGVDWEQTQLYDHPKYADDPERAARRCRKIERLIASVGANGYRSQQELDDTDSPADWIGSTAIADEIIVGLDRHGEFVHLKNGRHRLAVAQLLGVDRIPVILSLYHPTATDSIPSEAEPIGPEAVETEAVESTG